MTDISFESLETLTINDFNEICRLCPSRIHLTEIYNNEELINMLQFCTQLQFEVNDGLPDKICDNCVEKLHQTYNFINTCRIVDETYRKCLTDNITPQIKVETIYIEPVIKQEFQDEDAQQTMIIKQETPEDEAEPEYSPEMDVLQNFVRLGKQYGCNSLLMRYFTERQGAETLSMHLLITSFVNSVRKHPDFVRFCQDKMTDELCACAIEETRNMRKCPELSLELRYGRITSSKMYAVSCCETPDEYFIESIIGFYKINETKNAKTNEAHVQKIEKQLNVKIDKRGLILNREYPEFAAIIDGVTDDAVIKLKYPKNQKDYLKYVDKDNNLNAKTKTEMHLCMRLTNLKTSYLCIIDPSFANTNIVIKVDFNERYFAEVLQKSQKFWRLHMYQALFKTVSNKN